MSHLHPEDEDLVDNYVNNWLDELSYDEMAASVMQWITDGKQADEYAAWRQWAYEQKSLTTEVTYVKGRRMPVL